MSFATRKGVGEIVPKTGLPWFFSMQKTLSDGSLELFFIRCTARFVLVKKFQRLASPGLFPCKKHIQTGLWNFLESVQPAVPTEVPTDQGPVH